MRQSCLYEKEVQQRVVELGLITEKKIKRNAMLFNIWLPFFIAFVLVSVYAVNGAGASGTAFGRFSLSS